MTRLAEPAPTLREIEARDPERGFRSGIHALDDYFQRHARSNHENGIGLTFVLCAPAGHPEELPELLGYFTLCLASLEAKRIESLVPFDLPAYPSPALLIGRLALDRRVQGRGFGRSLLYHAFDIGLEAARYAGCVGFVVDAKSAEAEQFYARYGFTVIETVAHPRRMFIGRETVLAARRP